MRIRDHMGGGVARLALLGGLLALPALLLASAPVIAASASDEFWRVVLLRDFNTRVVVAGTSLLGASAGLIGTFLLLRKRALLSDSVAHSTLPGIALAFIIVSHFGGDAKNLFWLLGGAAITGTLGMAAILLIAKYSRLKDDAALGIVLSVFFGLGIALLKIATSMESGNAAGLNSFIYGKTASMLLRDAVAIGSFALVIAVLCSLLLKEFTLLCFDEDYARTVGYPAGALDFTLMALVVAVTVIGLQAVGLILVVAMLVIPPAAARFWTHDLKRTLAVAAGIGAVSGLVGSIVSALLPNLPAGALIVLVAAGLFALSFFLGSARGVVRYWYERRSLARRIGEQHLLRALFERAEDDGLESAPEKSSISLAPLLKERAWNTRELHHEIRRAMSKELVRENADGSWSLTASGARQARRVVRNHRLWELFLINYADVAPSHVDRDADQIEHILDAQMIAQLEELLPPEVSGNLPGSPHLQRTAEVTAT